jgi:hypothetical protein
MQKKSTLSARLFYGMMLAVIAVFAISSTGCGSAKHGKVKAKHTGCNCGF